MSLSCLGLEAVRAVSCGELAALEAVLPAYAEAARASPAGARSMGSVVLYLGWRAANSGPAPPAEAAGWADAFSVLLAAGADAEFRVSPASPTALGFLSYTESWLTIDMAKRHFALRPGVGTRTVQRPGRPGSMPMTPVLIAFMRGNTTMFSLLGLHDLEHN